MPTHVAHTTNLLKFGLPCCPSKKEKKAEKGLENRLEKPDETYLPTHEWKDHAIK